MTAEWDELGRETRYEYHPGLHLVSRRINPDGSELKYRYDNAKLFLSEIENEHGEQHRIHYFPNGLVARETGFDGRTTAYRYDLAATLSRRSSSASMRPSRSPAMSGLPASRQWHSRGGS